VTVAGTRKLVIEILGNAKDAAQAFGDVRKQSEITTERLDKFGTAALGAGVAIAGGLAFAVKEFVAADEQSRKLDNSIKNSTQSFSRGGDAIRELTTSLQNLSGADGDALVGASALAVQWGLSESQISSLLPLVNDLSLKMGVGVDQAMKAVLKATDGSTTALRKMGIQVDTTKASTDPFGATMDALKGSVQGFGEEVGNTSAGKLNILKQQLGDLVEAVGGGAMDVFGPVVSGLTEFVNGAGPAGQAAGDIAGKVLAISSAGLLAVGGIVKIKGAVDTAKQALTTATGELNNFGTAAKGVGMAAGAIGAAFAAWEVSQAINNATRDTLGFATALNNLKSSNSVGTTSASIVEMARASDGLVDKGWDIYNQFTNVGNLFGQHLFGSQTVEIDGMSVGVDSLGRMFKNLQQSGDVEALGTALQYVKTHATGDAQSMGDLTGALDKYGKFVNSSTTSTQKQAKAHEDAAAAADEQSAALKALTDPVFGVMRAEQQNTAAQQKATDAQNKLNFLRAAGKTNSADYAAAERDLRAANVDAGSAAVNTMGAYNTLNAAMQAGTITTGGFTSTLGTLQSKAGLAGTAASGLSNELGGVMLRAAGSTTNVDALGKTVDRTNGKQANVGVSAATDTAQSKLDRINSTMRSIDGFITGRTGWFIFNSGLPQGPTRATGGTVQSGKPYLVGERGPEVVVPGSGYVIPTRRLVDQQPAMAGGGGITVNVTAGVGDPVAIGRTVVESLKAYERTNGTAWRN
jgi:hypothetical protein